MATEIATKSIVLLPEMYPRFKVHKDRIKYFVEHIKSGKEVPPLKVCTIDGSRDDGKKYVLLDGCHRLEALRSLGHNHVRADFFDSPREHWLLLSARFNAESALPLTRGELKHAIIVSYLNGIQDTHKIAEVIGGACTLRYINKILKPLRQPARRKRKLQVLRFRNQGLTQQEIAKKVGVTQPRVAQIISKGTSSITYNDRDSGKLPPPQANQTDALSATEKPMDALDVRKNDDTAFPSSGTPNLGDAVRGESSADSSDKAAVIPLLTHDAAIEEFLEGEGRELRKTALALKADLDECMGSLCPSSEYRGPEKDSCVPDIEAFWKTKFTRRKFNALRGMELVKQVKWDLGRIAQHTGESIQFLRRVLIAAVALAICPKEQQEGVFWASVRSLQFDKELLMTICDGLAFEAMVAPLGEGMPEWLEDNLPASDIALIATLVSTESLKIIPQDIPSLMLQKKLPEQRTRYHADLPDDIKTRLEEMKISLRQFRDLLNKGMLRAQSLMEFMKLYNRIRATVNEIDEALKTCKKRDYL
jgi:hypothetical protein